MVKYLSPNSLFIAYISHPISGLQNIFYELFQNLVIFLFSPRPPRPHQHLNGPRVAVIGAGISGISAAAHCIGHGSDVVIYEAHSREHLGGIWSRVNSTSSLQIYSVMYRFHPSVQWHKAYPGRHRIQRKLRRCGIVTISSLRHVSIHLSTRSDATKRDVGSSMMRTGPMME